MKWASYKKGFESYLKLEKSLAKNTMYAYLADIDKLFQYFSMHNPDLKLDEIRSSHLQSFIEWIAQIGVNKRSQARIISGVRSFFKYLLIEDVIQENPASLLQLPRLEKKLPVVLSVEEIDSIIEAIDMSNDNAHRNRAIIETLYGCGLRVSELTELKLTSLFFREEFIKVYGKGNKERLIPLGSHAARQLKIYIDNERTHKPVIKGFENYVFLNQRGRKLTRVMIFTIIKNLCKKAGISKNVSPHTFRHSFATHLVEGGADLRVVQDLLGHESITTTEIYTHLDREYLRDTIMMYHPRAKK